MLSDQEVSNVNVPALLQYLRINALHRYGEWKAPCPSHLEKEPSWSIRDDRGRPGNCKHYCFGCGFGGGPVALVRNVLEIGHTAACDLIKERFVSGSVVPSGIKLSMASTYRFEEPAGVLFGPLSDWLYFPKSYVESRGITSEQVDRWRIGYCTKGRLAGRIFIPIGDYFGRPCSYTARTYVEDDLRYITPSSSEHFDDGAIFGEQEWPSLHSRGVLLVAEGAFNALALERAFPLSSFGSFQGSKNITAKKMAKMATFKRIAVATDPDRAGEAAFSAMRSSLYRHVEIITRVEMPHGEDPNSLSQKVLREAVLNSGVFL